MCNVKLKLTYHRLVKVVGYLAGGYRDSSQLSQIKQLFTVRQRRIEYTF